MFDISKLITFIVILSASTSCFNLSENNEREKKVSRAIEWVGLSDKRNSRPADMSGGECQRTAIARAIVHQPALILADEPTGNLDYANAQAVFEILSELQKDFNTALLMVTHDRQLAQLADKQLALQNGTWVA